MRYPQGETCRVKEKLRLNKPQEAEWEATNRRERELCTEGGDQAHRTTRERLTHWIPSRRTRATKQQEQNMQTREKRSGGHEASSEHKNSGNVAEISVLQGVRQVFPKFAQCRNGGKVTRKHRTRKFKQMYPKASSIEKKPPKIKFFFWFKI